jgi:flagellar motor switch protein FliG
MIVNPRKTEQAPTGVRKAAVLLIMLGEQPSADIMRQLSEDEVQLVSREVAKIPSISPDQGEAVLQEFRQMAVARDYVVKGGLDNARRMLVSAFGPDTAEKILYRLSKSLSAETEDFRGLQKADPQQLARFVQSEHPQTIALVVSQLIPTQGAALLMSLPPEIRSDVTRRMAGLDQISPEIIGKIAGIIHQKLKGLGDVSRRVCGGVRSVAELLNHLDSGVSKEILEDIGREDPALTEKIRHYMFVFEDLLLLDMKAIKELLARVDRKLLTVALKGTSDQLKNHLMQSMSQRGREMLLEDMEAVGPVKIREVEAAQQTIIAAVRQLEAEGIVSLKEAAGEQYVV